MQKYISLKYEPPSEPLHVSDIALHRPDVLIGQQSYLQKAKNVKPGQSGRNYVRKVETRIETRIQTRIETRI